MGQLRKNGIVAIEYRVDELLEVLRWNDTPERHAEHQRAISVKEVMDYIEVLGPEDRETALLLVLKSARIRRNAELVEAWLASTSKIGGER